MFRIKVDLLPGVDLRGDGGYVVAPPSIHENGSRYRWEIGLDDVPLAPMPEWLVRLLDDRGAEPKTKRESSRSGEHAAYGFAALSEECEALVILTKGTRNDRLNVAACKLGQLIGSGELDEQEGIERNLIAACERNGLIEDDGRAYRFATIRSGFNKGKQKPRSRAPAAANDNFSSCSGGALTLIKASDIEAKPIRWLWKPVLAVGKVSTPGR